MKQTKHNPATFRNHYSHWPPRLRKFRNGGLIVAGVTTMTGVLMIVLSKLAFLPLWVGVCLSLAAGCIAAYLIDGSFKFFFSAATEQAIEWQFGSRYWWAMFAFCLPLSLFMGFTSGVISWHASKELVHFATPGPEQDSLKSVAAVFELSSSDTRADFRKQERALNKAHKGEIKSIKAKYNTRIKEKTKQARRIRGTDPDGSKWLVNTVIPNLKIEQAGKIEQSTAKYNSQIAVLSGKMQDITGQIQAQKTAALSATMQVNEERRLIHASRLNKAKVGLSWFTVLGLSLAAICIILEQIIKSGSKVRTQKGPQLQPVANTEPPQRRQTLYTQPTQPTQTQKHTIEHKGKQYKRGDVLRFIRTYGNRVAEAMDKGNEELARSRGKVLKYWKERLKEF